MFKIFEISANILLFINFILFLLRFNKGNKAYRIYTIYLGVIVAVQIALKSFIYFGYENLVLSHAYFCGQFIMLSLFYIELLKEKYQQQIIKWNLGITISVVVLSFSLNPSSLFNYNPIEILFTSISLIVYSTFHFYNMLSNKKEFYYINCGVLIYLFGSTVTFLPRNLHYKFDFSFDNILQSLNIGLYITYLIFIFIEWYKLNSRRLDEK